MPRRSFLRGVFWTLVGLAVVVHAGGGWFFSDQLIEEAFVPDPTPIETPIGDYELIEASYQSPLGEMAAWHLPAGGSTWVIHVHGLGATPAEAEHLFGPLQDGGYPQLSITYRNDDGQPEDPSGFYRYGVTESADISGAVEYANLNGATSVVLSGFSTGASHILAYLYLNNPEEVPGLILDSPNLDMSDTVDFAAGMRDMPLIRTSIPPTVVATAKFFTSLRTGVNWGAIDYVTDAEIRLRVPVLLHHGIEDERVPLTQSTRLAEARPELVRLIAVPGAGHVGSFDAGPERYLEAILDFLAEVG